MYSHTLASEPLTDIQKFIAVAVWHRNESIAVTLKIQCLIVYVELKAEQLNY
jgi:hypothetical protein